MTTTTSAPEIRGIWHGGRRATDTGGPCTESRDVFADPEPGQRPPDAYGLFDGPIPDGDLIREYPVHDHSQVWADLHTLEANEPIRTAEQIASIQNLYNGNPDGSRFLAEFAERWRFEWMRAPTSCLLATYVGITVGIEPDGYTHS